jgi:DNA recombination protein RmuC
MERSTREARELGNRAGDIYNQVCAVAERLSRLGSSLQAANNHFNLTARALSGRQGLHGKVERFADMSSKVTKAMPEIEALHGDLQTENLQLLAVPLEADDMPQPVVAEGAADIGEDMTEEALKERSGT